MRIGLRSGLAGLFAILVVVSAILWALSWRLPLARCVANRPDSAYFIGSQRGNVRIWVQRVAPPPPSDVTVSLDVPGHIRIRGWDGERIDAAIPLGSKIGSHEYRVGTAAFYRRGDPSVSYRFAMLYEDVVVPWWSVILMSLLPPLLWLRSALVRLRRTRAGRCTACGYDLRGSSQRCPECGRAIVSQQSSQTPSESADVHPPSA